jgi:hypothetical protein
MLQKSLHKLGFTDSKGDAIPIEDQFLKLHENRADLPMNSNAIEAAHGQFNSGNATKDDSAWALLWSRRNTGFTYNSPIIISEL